MQVQRKCSFVTPDPMGSLAGGRRWVAATTTEEFPARSSPPIPSRPGMKYPIRTSPRSNIKFMHMNSWPYIHAHEFMALHFRSAHGLSGLASHVARQRAMVCSRVNLWGEMGHAVLTCVACEAWGSTTHPAKRECAYAKGSSYVGDVRVQQGLAALSLRTLAKT